MRLKIVFLLAICFFLFSCASSQKKFEREQRRNPQYQYNLGLFHLNNSNVTEAIKCLKRAVDLNPRHYLAHNALGLAYSMEGELEKSLKHYKKALEINPKFSEAHNNLGIIYQEMGFIDRAEKEYKKVLQDINYTSKELPYYNLARLSYSQENYENALAYVNKSINENRRFAMALNLKGMILEKLDNLSQAIDNYSKAIKIVPSDTVFNYNLAVALFKSKEFEKAKEIFEKIFPQVLDSEMKKMINQYLDLINKKDQHLS